MQLHLQYQCIGVLGSGVASEHAISQAVGHRDPGHQLIALGLVRMMPHHQAGTGGSGCLCDIPLG